MSTFLIGADPEVFVMDRKEGKFISAHGLVKGTKYAPTPVENGAVQVDGMALEFNISPASTEEEFVSNIFSVKQQLHQMIGADQFDLVAVPTVNFNKDVWEITPEEAKELGCDPDFDAWQDGVANPRPDNNTTMRTGAGHIHIGWGKDIDIEDPDHLAACMAVVKQLDASVGVASILWDIDGKRRELYGKAGAFRPKSYGVEYRVLSNKWLNDKALTSYVYKAVTHACTDLMRGVEYSTNRNIYGRFEPSPKDIINYSYINDSRNTVSKLYKRFHFPLPPRMV